MAQAEVLGMDNRFGKRKKLKEKNTLFKDDVKKLK